MFSVLIHLESRLILLGKQYSFAKVNIYLTANFQIFREVEYLNPKLPEIAGFDLGVTLIGVVM